MNIQHKIIASHSSNQSCWKAALSCLGSKKSIDDLIALINNIPDKTIRYNIMVKNYFEYIGGVKVYKTDDYKNTLEELSNKIQDVKPEQFETTKDPWKQQRLMVYVEQRVKAHVKISREVTESLKSQNPSEYKAIELMLKVF